VKYLKILLCLFALGASAAMAQSSPSAFTTGYRYNGGGALTGVIGPDPDDSGPIRHAAIRYTYDTTGAMRFVEEGELATWQSEAVAPADWSNFTIFKSKEFSYDSMGRKIWERDSAGGVFFALREFKYDSIGRLQCEAVRMIPSNAPTLDACAVSTEGPDGPDRVTYRTYDQRDLVQSIRLAHGTVDAQVYATFSHTTSGKIETITDAKGNKSLMGYDGHDRLSRWSFPSATSVGQVNTSDYIEYTYDENGNRRTLRRRDGQTITYTYDALNRVRTKDVPGSTSADV
jgi:YD repeat-containing protein